MPELTQQEKMSITKYDLFYEQRMTCVESAIENINTTLTSMQTNQKYMQKEIKSDFRWTIAMMVALLGVMAKGFGWL